MQLKVKLRTSRMGIQVNLVVTQTLWCCCFFLFYGHVRFIRSP
uniref:Uncharacterized protein n=1 Tax=Anguilla anguilla TaxID=7936 RepID=A0A0E9T882_ANGAN